MSIQLIHSLHLDGDVIGVRFVTSSGIFDVAEDALAELGVVNIDLKEYFDLLDFDGTFMTQDEHDKNMEVTELHVGDALLADIVKELKEDVVTRGMFNLSTQQQLDIEQALPKKAVVWNQVTDSELEPFKQPYTYTLLDFQNNSDWKAVPDTRKDGLMPHYYIILPNQERWSGGWIGEFNSSADAKTAFHKRSVKDAIKAGKYLDPEVYASYTDLKLFMEQVQLLIDNAYVQDTIEHPDILFAFERGKVRVRMSHLPTGGYISQRMFIYDSNLNPDLNISVTQQFNHFDGVDVVLYAMKRIIQTYK